LFPHYRILGRSGRASPGRDAGDDEMAVAATPRDQLPHVALFYRNRGECLTVLGDFIRASRARGDAVFVAVPERQAGQVRRDLGDDSAQVALVDIAELGRNPSRIIPEVLTYARSHRGQHVCCISEPIWPGRTPAEIQEATRHEALVNQAFHDSPVTFLCLYDSTGLPGWVIADAASTHPSIVESQRKIASTRYLRPPSLPPRCNQALPRPPAHAEALSYCDELRSVRSFVGSRAKRAGLTPSRISDLVLAISELAANTLRHTDGSGTVEIWQTGEEIICQVADTGQITDPLAMHRAPSDEVLGGKGLWLVNQVCDLVEARTGRAGTTTRLHMRLRRPEGQTTRGATRTSLEQSM
jgi:anti-sigma regulatory factor (Ser/Thr protein kinase)